MNEIIVTLRVELEAVGFDLATATGKIPVVLGLLVDDVENGETIWGITPSDPHFEHPPRAAVVHGVSEASSSILHTALNLAAQRFSLPLSSVLFGSTPEGFVANQPDDAVGLPQLVRGRRYTVTAMGLFGLGFLEFNAPSGR